MNGWNPDCQQLVRQNLIAVSNAKIETKKAPKIRPGALPPFKSDQALKISSSDNGNSKPCLLPIQNFERHAIDVRSSTP